MFLNCGVWEDSWESLDYMEIQPVHPKEDQSWICIGRTDVETESPVFWPPDSKSWLIWKDPDVGKDWRQEEKATTEDKMVGWHHQLNGHEFGWTLRVCDGWGGLTRCGSGVAKSQTRLSNWTDWFLETLLLCSCEQNPIIWKVLYIITPTLSILFTFFLTQSRLMNMTPLFRD